MRYTKIIVVILLVYFTVFNQSAFARTCFQLTQQQYLSNDVIFKGRYKKPVFSWSDFVANFSRKHKSFKSHRIEVLAAYKGDIEKGDIVTVKGSVNQYHTSINRMYFAQDRPLRGLTLSYCAQAMYGSGSTGIHGNPIVISESTFQSYAKEILDFNHKISQKPNNINLRLKKAQALENYKDFKSATLVYEDILDLLFDTENWRDWNEEDLYSLKIKNKDLLNNAVSALSGLALSYQEADEKAYKYGLIVNKVSPNTKSIRSYQIAAIKLGKERELDGQRLLLSNTTIFRRKSLGPIDFSGMDIDNSTFENSKLHNVDFTGANLKSANFKNAEIDGIIFEKTNLEKADFSQDKLKHGPSGNWSANFKRANLKDASLININLDKDTSFEGANLKGVDLTGSQIKSLRGARLEGANLKNMSGWGCDYSNVDMTGQDLSKSSFQGCSFRNSKLVNANLSRSNFGWSSHNIVADFRDTDLSGANLNGAALIYALYNCNTVFPDGFDPKTALMLPAWGNCEGEVPYTDFSTVELKKQSLSSRKIHIGGTFYYMNNPDLRRINFGNFSEPRFKGFRGSDIRGANMSKANIPKLYDIKKATYDDTTKWPEEFDLSERELILNIKH